MVHPPGLRPQRSSALFLILHQNSVAHITLHHRFNNGEVTNIAPSSTTCDLTLNYISKLTPSELHNSQQKVLLRLKTQKGAQKYFFIKSDNELSSIKYISSLSTSYILYLYYKMGKNPYIMTQKP
jgi:hypothetical protein